MTRKGQRFLLISVALSLLAVATGLVLFAMRDSIAFFSSPTDLYSEPVSESQRIRLGGLVAEGTVIRGVGDTVTFGVTDTNAVITVSYTGILPDLFREGQGVVTEGYLAPDGLFEADTVLARHDENYMPAEVAESLRQQGVWQGDGDGASTAQPGSSDY
ncbi:MAG: cytochrome c maturation protein CcmE [Devosiaceae bacterium]|nr:cytochrome c maturation protein CcmE [Devosiaceae bacterium MH13]